jgi:hypothetical protein
VQMWMKGFLTAECKRAAGLVERPCPAAVCAGHAAQSVHM